MNAWDVAAGSLLVAEAGGRVSDVWGKDYTLLTRNWVGSNGILHDELTQRLRDAECWMPQEG
jgi:myo-inositol-1(or 4)-monophosphatase